MQRKGEMAWKFGQSHLNEPLRQGYGAHGGHVMKRDIIRLVEHGSRIRLVGITSGNINTNNGMSTNFDHA